MSGSRRRRLTDFEEDLARMPRTPDDDAILSVAESLCRQLNLRKAPIYLNWVASREGGGEGFSLSFMAADTIQWGPTWLTLPKRLKGALSPEEWRPLLASSLIYVHQLRRKLASEEAKKAGIPSLLLAIPFYYYIGLPKILWAIAAKSISEIAVWGIVFFAPVVLVSILGSRLEKSLRFRADRRAADLLGKESLLSSLRKIQTMKFGELERWRPGIPKLSQRLGKLTRYSRKRT